MRSPTSSGHGEWRALAAVERGAFPVKRPIWSAQWFVPAFGPWLLLMPAALLKWRGLAEERLFVLAAVWLVIGGLITMIEPFAGWEFDFLVLMTPVAMLAARGLHGIHATWVRGHVTHRRTAVMVSAVALMTFAPLALGGAALRERATAVLASMPVSRDASHAHRLRHDTRYALVWQSTAFLRAPGSRRGPIYVFGDPLVQLLAERRSASPIHGYAWELQPDVMWSRLERDLTANAPPYILVSAEYEQRVRERAPAVAAILDRDYRPADSTRLGRWHERTASPP